MIGGSVSHYEIVELLSRQETGEIYKARDIRDGRHGRLVALEIFPARSEQATERLREEAGTVAGLDHPQHGIRLANSEKFRDKCIPIVKAIRTVQKIGREKGAI